MGKDIYESVSHELESNRTFIFFTFPQKLKHYFWSDIVKFENSSQVKVFCLLYTFININMDKCHIPP